MKAIRYFLTICLAVCLIGCLSHKQQYVDANPDLSPTIKNHILNGEVVIGMTEEQVEASWGCPSRQHQSFSHGLSTKTWVYGHSGYYRYFHFQNGKVTGVSSNF